MSRKLYGGYEQLVLRYKKESERSTTKCSKSRSISLLRETLL